MTVETRCNDSKIEIRKTDGKTRSVGGYAAVFDQPADIGGYFTEVIAPGAFSASLANDIRALVDHDTGRIIGRTAANTLRVREDDKGLAVEIDLPDTGDGRDLAALIERGDLSGMSFGFTVTKQTWDETDPDNVIRTLEEIDLHEVSIVAFPAYDGTSVALRSWKRTARTSKHTISPLRPAACG